MYGEIFGGHILLVYSWVEVLFTLTIPAFEGLLKGFTMIYNLCTQQKLFKQNEGSGEREQSIVPTSLLSIYTLVYI